MKTFNEMKAMAIAIVEKSKGDDLERAERSWAAQPDSVMYATYGMSRETRRDILENLRTLRAEQNELIQWIEDLRE